MRKQNNLEAIIWGCMAFFAVLPVVALQVGRLTLPIAGFFIPAVVLIGYVKGRFDSGQFFCMLLMLGYFAFTSMIAGLGPIEFVPAIAALSVCMSLFLISYSSVRLPVRAMFWGLMLGLSVSFSVAIWDIASSYIGIPSPVAVLNLPAWSYGGTYEVSGLNRVRSMCKEPSGFARQLVFVFAIVMVYQNRSKSETIAKIIVGVFCLVLLPLTFSISGILMIMAFVGVYYWRPLFRNPKLIGLFACTCVLVSVALVVLELNTSLSFRDVFESYSDRVERSIEDVRSGNLSSSSGSRIQSALLPFYYAKYVGLFKSFVGEGYSNYQQWMYMNFAFDSSSSFSGGLAQNVFSILFVSTGFLGVALYLVYMFRTPFKIRGMWLVLIVLLVLFQMSTGLLLYYDMWILYAILLSVSYERSLSACGPRVYRRRG